MYCPQNMTTGNTIIIANKYCINNVYIDNTKKYDDTLCHLVLIHFSCSYSIKQVGVYVNTYHPDLTFDYMQAVFDKHDIVSTPSTMNATSNEMIRYNQ